jgi:hypothetical protein
VSRLSIDLTLSPGTVASGEAGESLVLTGDLFALNEMLNTLKYQSPLNANGYDYISVTIQDTQDANTTDTTDSTDSGVAEASSGQVCITTIDTIIPTNYTNDAYIFDTYLSVACSHRPCE